MHEIRPRLWLGSYGAAADKAALLERGVTHVLTVGLKVDLLGGRQRIRLVPSEKDTLHRLVIAIQDNSSARLDRHFEACSDFILEGLASGGAVFVHCQAGQSRSPAVVAAYLMREERLTALQAVDSIRQRRPVIQPNQGFRDQLHSLELRLGLTSPSCDSSTSTASPATTPLFCQEGQQEARMTPSEEEDDEETENAEIAAEQDNDNAEKAFSPKGGASPGKEASATADDVYGTQELKLRSEKLKARCQQLKAASGLLSVAAPLRKRRPLSRPRTFGHLRRGAHPLKNEL